MLGIRYLKVAPTTHVLQFRRGKLVRDGAGLSFVYFAPFSEIALIPLASNDSPFVFNEVTSYGTSGQGSAASVRWPFSIHSSNHDRCEIE